MAFCDVVGLYAYWVDYPPVHEILKHVYRIQRKDEDPKPTSVDDPSSIGDLIARFPGGCVREV